MHLIIGGQRENWNIMVRKLPINYILISEHGYCLKKCVLFLLNGTGHYTKYPPMTHLLLTRTVSLASSNRSLSNYSLSRPLPKSKFCQHFQLFRLVSRTLSSGQSKFEALRLCSILSRYKKLAKI